MIAGRAGIIAGTAVVLVATELVAQQPQLQITLAEAIRRALDVQPAMVQARGDVRNAGASNLAAAGAFLPTINVGGSSNLSSPNRYNTSTGQQVFAPSNTSYSGSLSLNLNLFDGFQRLSSKRAAAANEAAADAGLVNQRYQMSAATAQVFFAALATEELVRVGKAQVDRAKEELQISVNKFTAGAATRSDTLTATVDLGNARLSLLQAEANLATAQANLGRQIGVDQLVRALPDTSLPPPPDTTGFRVQALESSPVVEQTEAKARAAGAQASVAHSEYWPNLSVSYSNGYTGVDSMRRIGLTPWSTTQNYVNNWALRFSLSWTIFNGFSREADQVSTSVLRDVAQATAADTRRQMNAQLTQQIAALFTAHAQISITGANVAAATEARRVTQERYRLGAGTLLDLLTAEANMTQAQVNEVQARYNYLVARAQVEALVGHPL
ncbi:MAG TPA: TolC family protein [Gemmatimonadales bacterium]|nr:TolC family protein [Gemmatimonadales bacterium]